MFPKHIQWGWQTQLPYHSECCTLWQVHGNNIVRAQPSISSQADAHWSQTPNQILCVRTADCLPILLGHSSLPWIAAIHGGWRSLTQDIIQNTLMLAPKPLKHLWVWIGPCIHAPSFAFDQALAHTYFPSHCINTTEQQTTVDLLAYAKSIFNDHGVHHIRSSLLNTYQCAYLPSYRRDRTRERLYSWIKLNTNTSVNCTPIEELEDD